MTREDKLAKLKSHVNTKVGTMAVLGVDGTEFLADFEERLAKLSQTLGMGVELKKLDELLIELERVGSISAEVKDLQEAIKSVHIPRETKIAGLDDLIAKIAKIEVPQAKVEIDYLNEDKFKEINKLLENINKSVKDNVYKSKDAADFVPMRRVQQIGNRLVFDDRYWGAGGSGGGASVQDALIRSGTALAVVNPDGTNIAGGGGGGGGASTIADGADVAEGATTDVAVTTDAAGTLSAKLRGLIKIFADVWDSAGHRLKVDGSGVTQPVSGTVTANAGTNLNTSSLATSTNVTGGGQKSQIVDGAGNVIGATTNALDINIKSGNPTTITATQGTASSLKAQVVSGDATGSAVPANGYFLGGRATTTLPSAATAGNLVGVATDKFGRIITRSEGTRELVLPMTQLTLTATTTETTLVAGVASTFNDLLSLVVTNTSASASQVDFRDSTGGTIRMTLYVPAGDTRGISFATPLPQNTVNTAWTAKCGASVSSIIITGHYVANM